MSHAEIERFIADVRNNPELLTEVQQQAGGLASVVDFAKSKGYDITAEEAKAYIAGQAGQDLSDEQLDSVAGGKGQPVSSIVLITAQQQNPVSIQAQTYAVIAST